MIKILLDKNKKMEPIFKLSIKNSDIAEFPFIKRAIYEGKSLKGEYNYLIPIRFFKPIINKLNKDKFEIDKNSITYYLEFSDDYDEKYYYITEANSAYMKKWRLEGCPNIYKIILDKDKKNIISDIAFSKNGRIILT